MEETGGIGVDVVIDNGGIYFFNTPLSLPPPLLPYHGRFTFLPVS
jgi:hypothetical protein